MQYTIKHGGAQAAIDTFGAELISYKSANGTQYVWTGDAQFWASHTPILFPIVGALQNDTVTIGGKAYTMPKHGFARRREWQAVEVGESSITLELVADDETLAQYPAHFRLQATHTLTDTGFTTKLCARNEGGEAVPMCLGGHPALCCPLHEGEQFEDYELVFEASEDCRPLYTDKQSILHAGQRVDALSNPTTMPLHYAMFDNDVLIFDSLQSRSVTLRHKQTHKGLSFSFAGFNHLGVWTPPGKRAPFLCLEPWKGLPAFGDETGAFEDKPDAALVAAGEALCAEYSVVVIE